MDVHINGHASDDCQVVTLCGQLDMDNAGRLAQTLAEAQAVTPPRIVVDLGGLTFCDSIGLSTLVVASRSCEAAGGYLRLARPSPFLLNLLTVVGVRDAVGVYESVEAARKD